MFIHTKCSMLQIIKDKLPYSVKKHQSKLLENIVVENINRLIIKQGVTFSFCKRVGIPTKEKVTEWE